MRMCRINFCVFLLQIFTVGKEKGHLYHIWQKEADASFSDWEDLGPLSDSSPFLSSPALLINKFGFWEAFAVSNQKYFHRFEYEFFFLYSLILLML